MTRADTASEASSFETVEIRDRIPPLSRTPFIGRAQEISTISSLLRGENAPLITLVGAGGVGKTRLAIHVAHEVAPHFSGGVTFVSLASVRDPSLVMVTIARAFGLIEAPKTSIVRQLSELLQASHLLLVLDNFEQVIDASIDIAALQRACPYLKILVTSRIPLRVSAEQRIVIHPLPIPPSDTSLGVDELGTFAGVQLFVARAAAAVNSFPLTAANASTVAAICNRLDGLPLAIELAASRLRLLDVGALSKRLEHALPLLTGGSRDQPDRLRTMREAIAWSYDLLTPEEQSLFRLVSVFVGGFDLTTAEAIAGNDAGVFEEVSSLVEKSLLRQISGPHAGEARFQMLETVREFGHEQLAAHNEEERLRAAHAEYFLELVHRGFEALDGPNYAGEMERLDDDHDNVRAALVWAESHGESPIGLRLIAAMSRYWVMRGYYQEGRIWSRRILGTSPSRPTPDRLEALRAAGWLARLQGDPADAAALQAEALAGAEAIGDELNAAGALQELSLIEMHRGNTGLGVTHIERALEMLRKAEQRTPVGPQLVSVALANLGQIALANGDPIRAIAAATEAVERQRALGYTWALGDTLRILGDALFEHRQFRPALDAYGESVTLTENAGDRRFLANALAGLANVAAASHRPTLATHLLAMVSKLRTEIGAGMEIQQRERYDRSLKAVNALLPSSTFAAEWNAGESMPLDLVVGEALMGFDEQRSTPAAGNRDDGFGVDLTSREFDVLRLVTDGLTDREIAELLHISPRTVGFHVTNLLTKLNVDSRTAAAAFALRNNLG